MRNPVVVLALCLCASAVRAEVYRCEGPKGAVYTDRPCAAGAAPAQLAPATVVDTVTNEALAREWDERIERERAAGRAANEAWREDHERRDKDKRAIRKALRERRVIKGMSERDVRGLLGQPDASERDAGPKGDKEKWTYTRDDGSTQTVSFVDGKVSAVRTTKAKKKR